MSWGSVMNDDYDLSRRDFLNGVALSLAAGTSVTPLELFGDESPVYPPALTGLRGSHTGSFEIAHAVSRAGHKFGLPDQLTDDVYDLIIVGGGISGLSAAYLYQQQAGGKSRILVLDNHDDFGGHAKRNEFEVEGKTLLTFGGSESLEAPGQYSTVSKQLLKDLAIDTQRFYQYFDQEFFESNKLGSALYFPKASYGKDVLAGSVFNLYADEIDAAELRDVVKSYPISDEAKAAIVRLYISEKDYLAGMGAEERVKLLRSISYTHFLHKYAKIPQEVTSIFLNFISEEWGVGWDSCSALEACRWELPGTYYLDSQGSILDDEEQEQEQEQEEPYIFHFPDGNASVARALVRQLIPGSVSGTTMEDIVLAQVHYEKLDDPDSAVRLRLNSTAVDIANSEDSTAVDVGYVQNGKVARVRGRHVVYAGNHQMLPHVCAELPAAQRAAIESVTKVPMVYISVAVRNWHAFSKLGVYLVQVAQYNFMHSFWLDFPVSMGGYQYTRDPSQPAVVHGIYVPIFPNKGLSPVEQYKLGRQEIYQMSFKDFESKIIEQMSGALSGGGFDAKRDIAGITVNRWPHGYAYEYNELFDDPTFGPDKGPHIEARERMGRISIANSDASAYAYVDGAIDAAHRAVMELLGV